MKIFGVRNDEVRISLYRFNVFVVIFLIYRQITLILILYSCFLIIGKIIFTYRSSIFQLADIVVKKYQMNYYELDEYDYISSLCQEIKLIKQ